MSSAVTAGAVPPAGAVLTGGASRRMGTDKALLEIDGRPMASVVADALRSAGCDPIWFQGGDRDRLASLGLEVRPDAAPDGRRVGPVRAVATALATASSRTLVVAACDLPCLTGEVVRALVAASEDRDAVAVAVAEGRRHLVSAWPVSVRPRLGAVIERGVASYGDVLADLGAVEVPVDPAVVRNVNRPADLPGQRYPRPAMTVQEISVDELAERLAAGARLVDVREPVEFEEERVPGGLLVPLAEVPDRIDDFRGDGTTYVICRSGGRSMLACEFLAERGLDVANVAGGTLAWIESGRDVAAGPA